MTNGATAISFDGNLTTSDYGKLEARWIDRELAHSAMLRRVDSLTGREIVGRKSGNYAGIVIPFVHPIGKHVVEQCIRRDEPDIEIHHGRGRRYASTSCRRAPRIGFISLRVSRWSC
jgi:hypothetical protein